MSGFQINNDETVSPISHTLLSTRGRGVDSTNTRGKTFKVLYPFQRWGSRDASIQPVCNLIHFLVKLNLLPIPLFGCCRFWYDTMVDQCIHTAALWHIDRSTPIDALERWPIYLCRVAVLPHSCYSTKLHRSTKREPILNYAGYSSLFFNKTISTPTPRIPWTLSAINRATHKRLHSRSYLLSIQN